MDVKCEAQAKAKVELSKCTSRMSECVTLGFIRNENLQKDKEMGINKMKVKDTTVTMNASKSRGQNASKKKTPATFIVTGRRERETKEREKCSIDSTLRSIFFVLSLFLSRFLSLSTDFGRSRYSRAELSRVQLFQQRQQQQQHCFYVSG